MDSHPILHPLVDDNSVRKGGIFPWYMKECHRRQKGRVVFCGKNVYLRAGVTE